MDAILIIARVDLILIGSAQGAQVDWFRGIDGIRVDQELQLVQSQWRMLPAMPGTTVVSRCFRSAWDLHYVLVVVFDRDTQVKRGFCGIVTGGQEPLSLQHSLLSISFPSTSCILPALFTFLLHHSGYYCCILHIWTNLWNIWTADQVIE